VIVCYNLILLMRKCFYKTEQREFKILLWLVCKINNAFLNDNPYIFCAILKY